MTEKIPIPFRSRTDPIDMTVSGAVKKNSLNFSRVEREIPVDNPEHLVADRYSIEMELYFRVPEKKENREGGDRPDNRR
jgi:hypothetical protein